MENACGGGVMNKVKMELKWSYGKCLWRQSGGGGGGEEEIWNLGTLVSMIL